MLKTSDLNIALISIYPFPIGMAATNRILSYSKGLVENNCSVHIFLPNPTHRQSNIEKEPDSGVYQGVSYYYTTGRYRARHKIQRGISILSGYRLLNGLLSTCNAIKKQHLLQSIDCIIISTDLPINLFVYSSLAKYLRIPSVFIFDEYPTPIRHKLKDKIPFWKELLYKQILKRISGYISISEKLAEYYNHLCIKKTFILPVITDTSRFEIKSSDLKPGTNQNKYICYMGNMELAKDNVDIIIKAFAIVSREIVDVELYLYGKPQRSTKEYLSQIIYDLNLQSKVKFQGQVSSDLVPQILQNAILLVSSQPDTLRASGGFPTKLGEYLASGVPAIFTDVGENAKYAKNNIHTYFVKPGNYQEYAEKILIILNNYEEAKIISENGRKLILNNYSHSTMAYKMKSFLLSLVY